MGGEEGSRCAWSPGACQSWCRSNSAKWARVVVDILDEVNTGSFLGFGVHVDALNPGVLRAVLRDVTGDGNAAALHAEAASEMGIDGIFGIGSVLGKKRGDLQRGVVCRVWVSGLVCAIAEGEDRWTEPPRKDVEAWEGWDWASSLATTRKVGKWSISSLCVERKKEGRYSLSRMDAPPILDGPPPSAMVPCTKEEAVDAVARTVGDDLRKTRMVHSRVFYQFECETVPRPLREYAVFVRLLDLLSHGAGVTANNGGGWDFAPKTTRRSGVIHVTLRRPPPSDKEISWGACLAMRVTAVTKDKNEGNFRFQVVTSW